MTEDLAPTTPAADVAAPVAGSFGAAVARARDRCELVVQPRMGFADVDAMGRGLLATRAARGRTVGTITVDSYTRLGQHDRVREALRTGRPLNGYPIADQPAARTAELVRRVATGTFPIQVRHGCARPQRIVRAMLAARLHATEGGPVSYCLPYGRVPLADSVASWRAACRTLSAAPQAHLESFGGCLLGQLCPPELLVALSLLEGLFFSQNGVRSVSLGITQQTNPEQDEQAVLALRRLASQHLDGVDWHVVVYGYMGRYPRTPRGADGLLAASVRLAVRTGAERLVVKTAAEAHRLPTIEENVAALEQAAAYAAALPAGRPARPAGEDDDTVYRKATALVECVLSLSPDVGDALLRAFRRGLLDVPYCLHPDNAGRADSTLDDAGRVVWSDVGAMPLPGRAAASRPARAEELLASLNFVADRYDGVPRLAAAEPALTTSP